MKAFYFKATAVAVMVLFLALGFVATALALEGVQVGDKVVVTAEVLKIDKAQRLLTLKGENGKVVEVKVGEVARNFDQIEVGDKLTATYYESVAIYMGDSASLPEDDAGMVMVRAPKGEMPAGFIAGAVDTSAKVVGIDRAKRTVDLELSDGEVVTRAVDPAVKKFDTLKEGDVIHARLTRAVAISVDRL